MKHSAAHPGFKAVAAKIGKEKGIRNPGAVLAAASRRASPAAKKANPRLNRVGVAQERRPHPRGCREARGEVRLGTRTLAVILAAGGADVPQRAERFVDPGKTPLGSPRPVGVGTVAKVGTETRQQRRARERESQKLLTKTMKQAQRAGQVVR